MNNLCRDINKITVGGFLSKLRITSLDGTPFLDPHFDKMLNGNDESNMTKLNSIMPVLNSAHLWGRYKQKFSGDSLTLIHNAPLLNQSYSKYVIYRNIHWIYGTTSLDQALK